MPYTTVIRSIRLFILFYFFNNDVVTVHIAQIIKKYKIHHNIHNTYFCLENNIQFQFYTIFTV